MEIAFTLFLVIVFIIGTIQRSMRRSKAAKKIELKILERSERIRMKMESLSLLEEEENVVEFVNSEGIPEFKYRFRANLNFYSPSSALLKHNTEKFIPRSNGNRDAIEELGGYWIAVSKWENAEIREEFEEEPFKYIGGSGAYRVFLLTVRLAYEDFDLSPSQKKEMIKVICEKNNDVYTVRRVHEPPWESLLVPVFSLAEGFGPHRVSLLYTGGIRTIADARKRTDAEILAIKGIGRAALNAVRNLSSLWPYDENTEIIERDAEYRRTSSSDHSVH